MRSRPSRVPPRGGGEGRRGAADHAEDLDEIRALRGASSSCSRVRSRRGIRRDGERRGHRALDGRRAGVRFESRLDSREAHGRGPDRLDRGRLRAHGVRAPPHRHNPLSTYDRLFGRGVLRDGALTATLVFCTPLVFTGLAAGTAAFRMQLYNIGGEGQLYWGRDRGVAFPCTWATAGSSPPRLRRGDGARGRSCRSCVGRDSRPAQGVREDERDHHLAHASTTSPGSV